ncbi:hypothetical protein BOH66_07020 [Microbacterium aurum]|uniref:Uncharacterized protein n=1 Tax=Microbacterium aurum TaxID=36805 RepID=A0A1P8U7F5_9MICO|nr:hypothetical protein [Microbacterium aurum]APZ34034.1 hypothetical protein BOH66_07020 [Microbacterium aurum]MBM7827814.1 hypothetical protein [Microbacterium aurum]
MCGSTTEEHTCACCRPGEPRRARQRALDARQKAARAGGEPADAEVREYRRVNRARAPRPGVVVEGGFVTELPQDPRHVVAAAGIADLGDDVRDAQGRVMWLRVPADKRWMRAFEGKPVPPPVRLPRALVDAEGRIDEAHLGTYDARKQAILRGLVRASFQEQGAAA